MFFVSCLYLGVCLFGFSSCQDANCDFQQNVEPGQSYEIYSPGYPNNYTVGLSCRWIGNCPSGYNCKLSCPEIQLPESQGCEIDKLLISKTGDPQLTNANVFCGPGSVTAVSTGQVISVGLMTASTSPGGKFFCSLTAQAASSQPSNCQCGYRRTNRIVGGRETGINEYPMMAILVDVVSTTIKCGSVIISNRYLVTAAHCGYNQPFSSLAVVVGEHDVTIADSPATRGLALAGYNSHPLFNPRTYDYDIAVLKTMQDIQFSDRVGPVCLPFKFINKSFAGETVTALGYGSTGLVSILGGGSNSDVLRKVNLQVASQLVCQASRPLFLTKRQICTFTPGKGACQVDSGGPLLYTDRTTGLLFHVGIIGSSTLCGAATPAVNTRVTEMLNWILSVTGSDQFCRK